MKQIDDLPRYSVTEDGQIWDNKKEHFVPQHIRNKKKGYLGVSLSDNGKYVQRSVHRLVAQAFIPNPNGLPMVNHKDEDPSNNRKSNLEWCDAQYNNTYGTRLQKSSTSQRNRPDCSKPVNQYDKDGNLIAQFPSAIEVERQTKIRNSQICAVCNHKPSHHTAGGYLWRWADEGLNKEDKDGDS